MDIEELRTYCLSLPHTSEDFPFDDSVLVFRVLGKIFALIHLERAEKVILKCNADYASLLRERYDEVEPAFHMNKKYWNQVNLFGQVPTDTIQQWIIHSYAEVVRKMTKKTIREYPLLQDILTTEHIELDE